MKNQRKKIIAIVLLLVILVLGGVSVFVATRISTQKPVAPNAPASKPQASEACGGSTVPTQCVPGAACPVGTVQQAFGGCAASEICCTVAASNPWTGSASCKITANIVPPPCTPRPGCLDEAKPCTPPVPAGGYCNYFTCDKLTQKEIYKDVAGNTAGVYNLDAANQMGTADTNPVVLYPGKSYIYSVKYSLVGTNATTPTVLTARITDQLDSRLDFVDATSGCTAEGGTVTCNVTAAQSTPSARVSFRVKVKDAATFSAISNKATVATLGAADAVIGNAICVNNGNVVKEPTVKLSCKKKTALNDNGTATINNVGPDQTITYSFDLMNDGDKVAPDTLLTDVLPAKMIFVDSASGCTFDEATRVVKCTTSLNAGETKKVSFRAKTLGNLTDGETISNTAQCKQVSSPADAVPSECSKDLTVALPHITAVKKAYLDNSNNQAGVYQLTDEIDSVAKNQVFVYSIEMTNDGTGTASSVTITDPLTGQGQDQLTLVDRDPKCDYSTNDKLITCHIDIQPGGTGRIAFRMKVSDGIANGTVIKNVGKVLSQGQEITVNKDLNVSTIVACNHTCTSDAECQTGFVCDTTSSKCRKPDCPSIESCVCQVAVTEAPRPTVVVVTKVVTPVPTKVVVVTEKPQKLPETGILDIPGVTVFGGGLLLAVVGLLLAL